MAQDAVQDLKVRHVARRHDDDAVIRCERDMVLQLGIRRADHIGESLGQLLPRVIDRHGKADIFQHRHERLPDMARTEEVDAPRLRERLGINSRRSRHPDRLGRAQGTIRPVRKRNVRSAVFGNDELQPAGRRGVERSRHGAHEVRLLRAEIEIRHDDIAAACRCRPHAPRDHRPAGPRPAAAGAPAPLLRQAAPAGRRRRCRGYCRRQIRPYAHRRCAARSRRNARRCRGRPVCQG